MSWLHMQNSSGMLKKMKIAKIKLIRLIRAKHMRLISFMELIIMVALMLLQPLNLTSPFLSEVGYIVSFFHLLIEVVTTWYG